jgi:AraC-like DNA-binding protein
VKSQTTSPSSPPPPDDGVVTLHIRMSAANPVEMEQHHDSIKRFLQARVSVAPDRPFDMEMAIRAFQDFSHVVGHATPSSYRHTADLIETDTVYLNHFTRGAGTYEQSGREVTISDGEGIMVTNAEPGVFICHGTPHHNVFNLDRKILSSLMRDVDDALMRPIPRNNSALTLMVGYAGIMNDDVSLATPELRHSVALHMHDLAALALGSITRDAAELALGRGVRAARLRAIKNDILCQLGKHALSIADTVKRHGLSEAYIRKLFAAEGTSFTEYVTQQRLNRAWHMLQDPRHRATTISDIALEAGFSDLSYFNRMFRRHYGTTPSDARGERE